MEVYNLRRTIHLETSPLEELLREKIIVVYTQPALFLNQQGENLLKIKEEALLKVSLLSEESTSDC